MKFLKALLALALLLPMAALAATANVTCTLPTTRTDGTALPASALASIKVYRATTAAGTSTATALATIPATSCTYTDTTAPNAQVYYALSVVDTNGVESARTNPVSLNLTPPSAPTNVAVTVLAADSTVFKQRDSVDSFAMVAVGTAPAGTVLMVDRSITDPTGTYCLIPRAAAKPFSRFDTLPLKLFAKCS